MVLILTEKRSLTQALGTPTDAGCSAPLTDAGHGFANTDRALLRMFLIRSIIQRLAPLGCNGHGHGGNESTNEFGIMLTSRRGRRRGRNRVVLFALGVSHGPSSLLEGLPQAVAGLVSDRAIPGRVEFGARFLQPHQQENRQS